MEANLITRQFRVWAIAKSRGKRHSRVPRTMFIFARMTLSNLILAALFFIAPAVAPAAVFPRTAPIGQCRTVHGRLALYNGTFSFRIWIIGTHRLLRVVDSEGDNFNELEKLPPSLSRRLRPYENDLFGPSVFGDFTVCAFTKSKRGVMQSVTLTAAKKIRIEAR